MATVPNSDQVDDFFCALYRLYSTEPTSTITLGKHPRDVYDHMRLRVSKPDTEVIRQSVVDALVNANINLGRITRLTNGNIKVTLTGIQWGIERGCM